MFLCIYVDCILWTRKDNVKAFHGIYKGPKPEFDCKAECVSSPTCVAVGTRFGICIHHNADDLANSTYSLGWTQFVLNRSCQPTSTARPTTERPTTKRQTTERPTTERPTTERLPTTTTGML